MYRTLERLETGNEIISQNGEQDKRIMARMKAYKIQDVNRKKRTGIVADSLADLKRKGMEKLAMTKDFRVCLEDGTEVEDDDYFNTLPHQTVFMFVRADETWEGCKKKKQKKSMTLLKYPASRVFFYRP